MKHEVSLVCFHRCFTGKYETSRLDRFFECRLFLSAFSSAARPAFSFSAFPFVFSSYNKN